MRNNVVDERVLIDNEVSMDVDGSKDDITEEISLLGAKQSGHRRTAPNEIPPDATKNNQTFTCTNCNVSLESKGLLKTHMKTHVTLFTCDTCSEQFEEKSELDAQINEILGP